ncbi:hypothetical protein DFH06DRAFT_1145823 [Mycena polygramma]|nr:hypothetical protein DFH06DRAFT_1145823 [Mycena polygramma]
MPQTPPPVYSEVDDAQLHIRIAALNLDGVPLSPSRSAASGTPRYSNASAVVSRPPPPPPVLYTQSTPGSTVLATSWAEAADETQGVSGASPQRVTPKRKKKKPSGAYAVFCGLQTGPFLDWADVQALVIGVPNNVYKGYRNFPIAEAAYLYAHQRGWTRVISRSSRDLPTTLGPALRALPLRTPILPTPCTTTAMDVVSNAASTRAALVAPPTTPGTISTSPTPFSSKRWLTVGSLLARLSFAQPPVNHPPVSPNPPFTVSRLSSSMLPVGAIVSDHHHVPSLPSFTPHSVHSEALSLTVMSSTQLECPAPLTHFQVMQLKRAEERSKTRARMARFRRRIKELPPEQQEPFKARARDARARYKAKCAPYQPPLSALAHSLAQSPVQAAFPRQHDDFLIQCTHYACTDVNLTLGTDAREPHKL